jgi:flagellar hook-associated protein 1 FlgK
LENQRDAVVHSLSEMVGIKTLNQPNGNLIINTASGTQLPTDATTGPLLTLNSTIGAGSSYAGGTIPPITMGGIDITSQLQGGSVGANIALRDVTMPTFSAELDEFSSTLANQFSAQGLTLFADPNGNVPVGGGIPVQSGYVGFASEIQVNPAVIATPSLVRDGTQDTAGSPVGASVFVTNPPGGPAGFTALINRVLNFTFGVNAQPGVPQPASNTFGLGVDGNLAAPYASPSTLAEGATALVSAQAAVSAAATSQLGTEQTVQTALNNNMSAVSGVNMDTEMSHMIQLQNAYGANARVISAVQAMFSQLLQSIQ